MYITSYPPRGDANFTYSTIAAQYFSLHVWLYAAEHCMSSIVATTLKLLYTGGLITEYVMIGSQVQWLPVLYVEPICTISCYTNRFSLHVHVLLGSCR